jgi:hypothetical protein
MLADDGWMTEHFAASKMDRAIAAANKNADEVT